MTQKDVQSAIWELYETAFSVTSLNFNLFLKGIIWVHIKLSYDFHCMQKSQNIVPILPNTVGKK